MKRTYMVYLFLMTFFPFLLSCQTTAAPENEIAASVSAGPVSYSSPPVERPLLDEAPPVLEVSLSTEYFNSFVPGEDSLEISINLVSEAPIREWKIQVMEPLPSVSVFYEWSGFGAPPASVSWDGSGKFGAVALSASTYPLRVSVTDENGLYSLSESDIQVGIIVIRESDNSMRIRVPSITFAPNSSSLSAWLSPAQVTNNDRVLREIAQALNQRFGGYRVRVEGHTNFSSGEQASQALLNLGNQRARAVVDYLIALNVNRIRLSTVGIGGALPIASFDDPNSGWKNYRIDFVILRW
ncbi:MAG: OmpA family protein [Spirochaetes bacterium]|nr:OmpA family protein [Spirochaetota bacterium]